MNNGDGALEEIRLWFPTQQSPPEEEDPTANCATPVLPTTHPAQLSRISAETDPSQDHRLKWRYETETERQRERQREICVFEHENFD
jgi:hypothetical protein